MGPIDPHQLLKALDPLLAQNGAIKGPNEAARVASLMKDVSKLVSKCIYINILKCTESPDTLERFIDVGGWQTLNQWLVECKDSQNTAFLVEMLKVYQKLPITVDLLKKNNTAKTIRQLGKSESDLLKNLSKEIVDQWTKKVRENTTNESNDTTDKKKKSDKKDKEREKDRGKDRDIVKQKHSNKHRDDKTDSKNSKSKNTDSDMDTSDNKKMFQPPEVTGIVTQGNGLKLRIKMERKDPDKSDGDIDNMDKKRPSTVKRPNTKFRSTGLEEDPLLVPKKKESPSDVLKSHSKRTGSDQLPKEEPPEKKSRLNIFTQLTSVPVIAPPSPSTPVSTPSPTTISPAEVHTKLRITPPKVKTAVHKILDSSGFMDEMMKNDHRTPGVMKRKKKTPTTTINNTTPPSPTTTTSSPSTPTQSKLQTPSSPISPTTAIIKALPMVPSFYQDTLVTSEDIEPPKEAPVDKERSPSPPILTREVEMEHNTSVENNFMETEPQDVDMREHHGHIAMDSENYLNTKITVEETAPKVQLKGLLIYSKAGKRTKKKVSWVEENGLRQFYYFEMDETERENVNRPKPQNFDEMKRQESLLDKKAVESARRLTNDNMVESMPWKRPPLIDGLLNTVDYGSESTEKNIQKEREQHVLQAIFFSKDMLPDSPAEPDMESVEPSDPKFIPLEDENSGGDEYYFSHDQQNHHHQQQQSQHHQPHTHSDSFSTAQQPNLPPEVSNLLASFQQQPGNAASAVAALADTTNPVIATVQNILSTIMGSGNDPHKTEEAVVKLRGILDPHNSMQAYGQDGSQQHPGAPHGMQMGPGPVGPGGPGGPPPGMHGPPGGPVPGGPHMQRQGLLGQAPPGFHVMGQGPGPQGPPGPRFPPQGPGLGPGEHNDEWGENMGQGLGPGPGPGPGPMRGRGGMAMRGGRMPPPGHMGQQGPPQGHPGQQGPGGPRGPHPGQQQPPGGPQMGPGGPQMGPGGPGGPHMGPGPGGPPMRGRGRGRGPPKERPICRHFAAGGCRRGNTCAFLHPGVNGPPV